jgi:hypothetical protein
VIENEYLRRRLRLRATRVEESEEEGSRNRERCGELENRGGQMEAPERTRTLVTAAACSVYSPLIPTSPLFFLFLFNLIVYLA